jgi:hypothetical protein
LFLVFNRPALTKQVFNAIRQARPSKLFVAADGPRKKVEDDEIKCRQTRRIVEQVDWECEVKTLFSEENQGCKLAVSSAIDWFFRNVDEGIILEDDCLPSQSFFWFCQDLLGRYRDDTKIMMISGLNLLGQWKNDIQDYHFSTGGIWGWATWRRAWQLYNLNMEMWQHPEGERCVRNFVEDEEMYQVYSANFNNTLNGKVDTWDYQWKFARFINSGMSINPAKNLVSNIGFGPDATHGKSNNSSLANMPTYEIEFPLRNNRFAVIDREYTKLAFIKSHAQQIIAKRQNRKIVKAKKVIKRILKVFVEI